MGEFDPVALDVEHRALLEPGAHLVHTDHTDVSTGVHRPGRKLFAERKVRAPGLIDDRRLVMVVADLDDRLDVGARPVGSRADDQRTRRVRVVLPGSAIFSGDGG